ncbi:hypothetical protein SBRY_11115 [Actinacidiphila bryophytorum]|uniref:Uncharacterized protein n=1 Tax=Actinacidiphila bryophytorum TaxID=1436133 RepID=A0A9W4GXU8_9ACTN|nr:hypothetical protein SBRY_11115 [Actinacidiphila bryophytorum]
MLSRQRRTTTPGRGGSNPGPRVRALTGVPWPGLIYGSAPTPWPPTASPHTEYANARNHLAQSGRRRRRRARDALPHRCRGACQRRRTRRLARRRTGGRTALPGPVAAGRPAGGRPAVADVARREDRPDDPGRQDRAGLRALGPGDVPHRLGPVRRRFCAEQQQRRRMGRHVRRLPADRAGHTAGHPDDLRDRRGPRRQQRLRRHDLPARHRPRGDPRPGARAAGRAGHRAGGVGHRHRLGLRALPVRGPQRPLGQDVRVLRRDPRPALADDHRDHRAAGRDPGRPGLGAGHRQALHRRRRHRRRGQRGQRHLVRGGPAGHPPAALQGRRRPRGRLGHDLVQQLERRQGPRQPLPDHRPAQGRTRLLRLRGVRLGGRRQDRRQDGLHGRRGRHRRQRGHRHGDGADRLQVLHRRPQERREQRRGHHRQDRRRQPAHPDQEVRTRAVRAPADRPLLHLDGRLRRTPAGRAAGGARVAGAAEERRRRAAAGEVREGLRGRQVRRRHRQPERRLDDQLAGLQRRHHPGHDDPAGHQVRGGQPVAGDVQQDRRRHRQLLHRGGRRHRRDPVRRGPGRPHRVARPGPDRPERAGQAQGQRRARRHRAGLRPPAGHRVPAAGLEGAGGRLAAGHRGQRRLRRALRRLRAHREAADDVDAERLAGADQRRRRQDPAVPVRLRADVRDHDPADHSPAHDAAPDDPAAHHSPADHPAADHPARRVRLHRAAEGHQLLVRRLPGGGDGEQPGLRRARRLEGHLVHAGGDHHQSVERHAHPERVRLRRHQRPLQRRRFARRLDLLRLHRQRHARLTAAGTAVHGGLAPVRLHERAAAMCRRPLGRCRPRAFTPLPPHPRSAPHWGPAAARAG